MSTILKLGAGQEDSKTAEEGKRPDGSLRSVAEERPNDPTTQYMNKLPRNMALSDYHDTLYITLMLILKSRHILTYLQIGMKKGNADLLKQLV